MDCGDAVQCDRQNKYDHAKKEVVEGERKGGLFDCHTFSIVAWSELKLSNEGGPCTNTDPFF